MCRCLIDYALLMLKIGPKFRCWLHVHFEKLVTDQQCSEFSLFILDSARVICVIWAKYRNVKELNLDNCTCDFVCACRRMCARARVCVGCTHLSCFYCRSATRDSLRRATWSGMYSHIKVAVLAVDSQIDNYLLAMLPVMIIAKAVIQLLSIIPSLEWVSIVSDKHNY